MSLKQKLKEIAENASKKEIYDADIVALGEKILVNWLPKCMDAASEKQKELKLFLFSSTSTFNERRIFYLAENGLIDYLKEKTELDATLTHFLLEKKTRLIEQYDELNFDEIEEFHHLYLIKLRWE